MVYIQLVNWSLSRQPKFFLLLPKNLTTVFTLMGTTQLTQFAQGRSINRLICKNNDSVQTRGGRVCTWPNTLENLRQKRFLLLFHVHTLMKGYHFLHNLSLLFSLASSSLASKVPNHKVSVNLQYLYL